MLGSQEPGGQDCEAKLGVQAGSLESVPRTTLRAATYAQNLLHTDNPNVYVGNYNTCKGYLGTLLHFNTCSHHTGLHIADSVSPQLCKCNCVFGLMEDVCAY